MPFQLDSKFVSDLHERKTSFGYNGLGETVFYRTYSRSKSNNSKESWADTIIRVVEGTYNMQLKHMKRYNLPWNDEAKQKEAQEMATFFFNMNCLPPGRGLWAMGSPITQSKELYAALNNCGFVSTEEVGLGSTKPFEFLMDMSMCGVGVGFDTLGAGWEIKKPGPKLEHKIEDTREGWVSSTAVLLNAYFNGKNLPVFDYSLLRAKGEPLKVFGGVSSGPEPLKKLHERIDKLLGENISKPITSRIIVDIMNLIGVCVVSGNVRRSSELSMGTPEDQDFVQLKNYSLEKNKYRMEFGWASNNSLVMKTGSDYKQIAKQMTTNGEPGIIWLENARKFGRLADDSNNSDYRVKGVNPCAEQSLESYELCCLAEVFLNRCSSKEEFLNAVKYAYIYAKTVTLGQSHWSETNTVMMRNRRIGISLSGISQFVESHSIPTFIDWMDSGYKFLKAKDKEFSETLAIRESIKLTTLKPSGSISLLTGSTPGVHYPISRYYTRRVTLSDIDPILNILRKSNYRIEKSKYSSDSVVAEFPIDVGPGARPLADVTVWEQFALAALIQEHWSDNQVSVTVSIKPEENKDLARILDFYQYKLKSVSVLPHVDGVWEQAPYSEISKEVFEKNNAELKPVDFSIMYRADAPAPEFCDGAVCEVRL